MNAPISLLRTLLLALGTLCCVGAMATPYFGNNSSTWANDGECDDPAFENAPGGGGMAATLLEEDRGRDANDCRDLFNRGMIRERGAGGGNSGGNSSGINFGSDTSTWANDGECDDPRFENATGNDVMGITNNWDYSMGDATDCRSLFNRGLVRLRADSGAISFGGDTSTWSNDGECDDPRFENVPGNDVMGITDNWDYSMGDATDCRNLFNVGKIRLRSGGGGGGAVGGSCAGVDFGDNTSQWANDGECDDSRFHNLGSVDGMGIEQNPAHQFHDANDCRQQCSLGVIGLRPGMSGTGAPVQLTGPHAPYCNNINFGDNTSQWANDGECDDTRFRNVGNADGMSVITGPDHQFRDANDCRNQCVIGNIQLIATSNQPYVAPAPQPAPAPVTIPAATPPPASTGPVNRVPSKNNR